MGRSKKRKMRKAKLRCESERESYRVAKAWRNIFVKAGIIEETEDIDKEIHGIRKSRNGI